MEVYGIIYLLIDGTNDLEYVGQTIRSFKARFRQHMRGDQYIDRVLQKRGADLFATAILKICYSQEELDYWEKYFIKARNTISPNGYNLTEGGEGGKPCDEVRARIGAAGKGKKKSPEHRAKIGASERGKKQPPEAKAKISAARKGKSLTPETIAKLISIARRSETPYKNLIAEMREHNLSYAGLAKILGITKTAVSLKMRVKKNFTKEQSTKLENFFGLPVEYLLARDDGLTEILSKEERNAKLSVTKRHVSPYKNLLNELDARKLSYHGFAKLLGLSQSNISLKMRGKQNFTNEQIAKMVEFFGKPAEYLLARDDA
ncbi:MAG: helix-turn-helix domain-containing protein [Selenomonadaceae bacterium]|nr:helix-turn-helix domain-containing protein [Selenomonadaceae bacterium]